MAQTCKNCDYQSGASYSLWDFNSPFVQSFQIVKDIKKISLTKCSKCGQEWLMHRYGENNNTVDLDSLPEERKAIFELWANTPLSPTKEQLKVLKGIKGLNGDAYGNGRAYIDVPCKAKFKDGTENENCLLRFSQKFPMFDPNQLGTSTRWISDVKSFAPSPNALPYVVRYETSQAEELRNSYAPTFIEDPEGNVFFLNWLTQFFKSKKYNGAQFKLYKDPHGLKAEIPEKKMKASAENIEVVMIYADWTEGLEKML